ncbi:MAG: insulinase family protein [Candidatus Eisenbacteria bacterium]|uniref:Insulinase family protein n=1 Tax=Eiseniibacteriota bacterium TaxID=2212470 RepID=A0A849SES6_UNCEI|nr:insulinase family protein [Candidatus Eisenbacteria bacterium]
MSDLQFQKTVLPSGMTVLSEPMPDRRSIAFGAFVRSGARDEPSERLGITHFVEHMMFKGTERRDARAIAHSLESLGGHLDAFTAREQVCYYARALGDHLPEVVDVVADILSRSRFAPNDIEREKSVVCEEILAYDDNPEERVQDQHARHLWGEHGLGRPILGSAETVRALTREDLVTFHARRYRADQLVISGAGGLDHDRLCALVEQHFAPPGGDALALSRVPPPFIPAARHAIEDVQQLYVVLSTRGVPDDHPDRDPLVVLNTLFGGGMSSRLFQSVREEAGLAYSVYSALEFHRDCGALGVHMGVSPARGREALARVRTELSKLAEAGPEFAEFEAAKSQIRGSILLDHESVSSRMFHLAGEEILRGRYTPTDELVERVLAVTFEQVRDVARRYLIPESWALTALGPATHGELGASDWPIAARVESS